MDTFDPAFLLVLVFVLSFSALLLRKRAKIQTPILVLSYLTIGPWLIYFAIGGSIILIDSLRGNHWTSSDIAYGAILLWALVAVIFGVLAHRRKDVLLLTTAVVTVVISSLMLGVHILSL